MKPDGSGAKNRFYCRRFRDVPYSKRILLLPQCLRNHKRCKAADIGWSYVCRACGSCRIGKLITEARRLGYHSAHILKGGRAIEHVLRDVAARRGSKAKTGNHVSRGACKRRGNAAPATPARIRAVLGVACNYEGALGIALCEKHRLVPQFVPLLRDGCVDTDVEWKRLRCVLRSS